ncbi:unnamed protein product [Mytilus coruscus]|uniref:C-type lectin domain-containing protein n=1 Tax=Mytilus coruscus TaxID=42192 RepID=A0A6J8EBQ5_MYTCO|nr:unnamed protein product [Mytilus coruscus]
MRNLAGLPSKSSDYPPILLNDTYLDDNKDKANAFNRYFCDQSSVDDSSTNIPEINLDDVIHTLDNIIITQEEVYDQLLLLGVSKATGPDSISPRFLKYAARELSYPLALLFNKSLQLCIYPYDWKIANVIPVFKSGSQEILSNYRPISLLSIIVDGGQIQHYSPYGINWNEASLSCGSNGLEISEEDLESSDVLENQELWIGKTPVFTPWVELLGCYVVHGLNETEFYPLNTRSECQKKCHHVKHFGFKKTTSRSCVCIPFELLIDNRKNMSACKELDSYYVYTEDRKSTYWGATQNEGVIFCASKQQLLVPSTFCNEPGISKLSGIPTWTNVIREQLAEYFKTNCTTTPLMCPAGVINTVNSKKVLNKIEKACDESLQWFICNSNSSPITYQSIYTTMSLPGMSSRQMIGNQRNTETRFVKGLSSGVTSIKSVKNECQKIGILKDTGHYADLKMENQNTCNNDVYFTVID